MLSCFSLVELFATLQTVVCEATLSTEFSRQKYSSGLPCPPPGDLPKLRISSTSPESPAMQVDFFSAELLEEPHVFYVCVSVCVDLDVCMICCRKIICLTSWNTDFVSSQ